MTIHELLVFENYFFAVHFFQVAGWYFELSQFNRSGYNTGWLISNLVKVKNESEKNLLRKYVYYEAK